jgi:hypothetical protein
MEQALKLQFPNFIINDASNRNSYELLKITELCHKIDKFLVFIKRNKKNDDYFKRNEEYQNTKKINIILLNRDDIYFYDIDNEDKINIVIMSLKRKLLNETECIICMEQCVSNYMSCSQCGIFTHIMCLEKCDKQICYVCKNNSFLHYN